MARKNDMDPNPNPTILLFLSQTIPSNDNERICVVIDDDEENDKFLDDARNTARILDIPLFSASDITTQCNNEFAHALRLVPYEYGNELSTFALAIEPINNASDEGTRRRQQKRRSANPKKQKQSSSSAFFVDLCPPKSSRAGRRAAGTSGTSDLLVNAVGPRKGIPNSDSTNNGNNRDGAIICDLTAGLGQDSLILAMNGAQHVHMVERNPIVAALLRDAMRRLELISNSKSISTSTSSSNNNDYSSDQQELATILLEKLSLTIGEGKDVLQKQDFRQCDVVYLDPMFPPRQKQAAVKKGMSILHGLLETQSTSSKSSSTSVVVDDQEEKEKEEQELLSSAIDAARLRVVVKRPIKAPQLGDGSAKPSYAITGSVNRWDVYVKPPLSS